MMKHPDWALAHKQKGIELKLIQRTLLPYWHSFAPLRRTLLPYRHSFVRLQRTLFYNKSSQTLSLIHLQPTGGI